MEAIETFTEYDVVGSIFYDEFPCDPRAEYDQLGTMICGHRRYRLGDVQVESAEEGLAAVRECGGVFTLPLYLYDHSGISMSTGRFPCSWDSGMVGVITIDAKTIQENFGTAATAARTEVVRQALTAEVKEYDAYLSGETYRYEIESKDGEFFTACGGFIGDVSYVADELRLELRHHAAQRRKEALLRGLRCLAPYHPSLELPAI